LGTEMYMTLLAVHAIDKRINHPPSQPPSQPTQRSLRLDSMRVRSVTSTWALIAYCVVTWSQEGIRSSQVIQFLRAPRFMRRRRLLPQ
jgi:hypothetical protein